MHSYQHHIKDFNNATRHLTRVERSLYRDAIELYYETEQPLPADDFNRLARRLMAITDEERDALKVVLDEFFDLTGDVYSHDRCDEEIEKFHNAQTAKSAAGKASAEARRKRQEDRKESRKNQKSTDVEQVLDSVETDHQQNPTNQKPRTINHKPLLKEKYTKENTGFEEFWNAYPKKVGKQDALKIWNKKKPDIGDVLNALCWQTKSQQWLDGFIPNPSTYLNQGRWEDEPQPEYHARGSPSQTKMDAINSAARAIFKGHINNERDITSESEVIEHSFDS